MDTTIAIMGAGPAGTQTAIELAQKGIDCLLIDKSLGKPEAPDGCVTVPRRSSVLGTGHCGQPEGTEDWTVHAECELHHLLIAGKKRIGRYDSKEVLGYNFLRKTFWGLMIDAAKIKGARTLEAEVTGVEREPDCMVLYTTGGTVRADALVYAAGVRGRLDIARSLGLGVPPLVHGIYADFDFDFDPASDNGKGRGRGWQSPELSILFNQDLVPRGYFWAAIAPRAGKVSIGILNETPVDKNVIFRFTRTKILPELNEIPENIEINDGILGAVGHIQGNEWPVNQVAPRVIGIGEATGTIASYIYEGVFEGRFQGIAAARVLSRIAQDGRWDDLAAYKQYEREWQPLNEKLLRFCRQYHYALYHTGDCAHVITDAYLKALNNGNKAVNDAMRDNYLTFTRMNKHEVGMAAAIIGNTPFIDKLRVTTSLLAARAQK